MPQYLAAAKCRLPFVKNVLVSFLYLSHPVAHNKRTGSNEYEHANAVCGAGL